MIKLLKKIFTLSLILIAITILVLTKFIRHKTATNESIEEIKNKVYQEPVDCLNYYDNSILNETIRNNYNQEADLRLHELRIVRAIIFYYPIEKHDTFMQEFRWVYRSWIEMQMYEPIKWRTDLILFTGEKSLNLNIKAKQFFDELNCKTVNIRNNKEDKPMCTIRDYIPINDRIKNFDKTYLKSVEPLVLYSHLYKDVHIYDDNDSNIWKFHAILNDLSHYGYLDSIMVGFDGYGYFKNRYDFLLRSDLDVFLTPLFANWLPLNCNDFITGGGGYSGDFNMKRIQKAAKMVNLKPGHVRNLGSTWYSTPTQFRLVSYLTLVSMVYLSNEEFSLTEQKGKVGTILW